MDPSKTQKNSTVLSAFGFVGVVAVIIAAIAAIFLIPGALENLIIVCAIIIMALAVICVIIAIATGLIALPMYAHKGEEYQTDMSYSIDDVHSVSEKDNSEDSPKY